MSDIHQSSIYAQFMVKIGWIVETIDDVNIFIKKISLFPPVIKIQRNNNFPDFKKLKLLMKKYHASKISIEPSVIARNDNDEAISNLKLLSNPYLPTKTIYIDLSKSENNISNNFTEAKRRAIRKAKKLGINISQTNNIDDFIKLKNKSTGFLGFLTTRTIKPLWQTFSPKNAFCLLARRSPRFARDDKEIVAGVLILIWQKTAYYWMAAASNTGKKSFAPTSLVWESLKIAKKMGCTNFDFEGIYDERYSKLNKDWLGFTKFKSGFGGKEIYFPKPFTI